MDHGTSEDKQMASQPAPVSQKKRVIKSDWKALPFAEPKTNPWLVPLPDGAFPKLLQGFLPKEMEDRYFVYCDDPDDKGHAILHILRSWTGYPIADVTISVPLADGQPVENGEGARFTRITYDTSQERWDYEGLGRADLATSQGFVINVCGEWVFDVKFPKPIWLEVQDRYNKATKDYLRALEEGE